MSTQTKLRILADAAKYDASSASSGSRRRGSRAGLGSTQSVGICHSYTPDGRCISLLKVLLTNACVYDCSYCVNRISSSTPRAAFGTEELSQLTIDLYRRNYIEGLFLSSGIVKSPDETMARLSAVAEQLRHRHRFRGYIHLKAVPGASEAALAAAGRYADRLSANVELPTQEDLSMLAPAKRMEDVEASMSSIRRLRDISEGERREAKKARKQLRGRALPPRFAPAGQSTQMVVGATRSPDRAILNTAERLYGRHRLRRVYYSAFSPIPAPAGSLPPNPPPLVREHRLYQADWLIRNYGFQVSELFDTKVPNLDLELDPKLAWALRHRERFPVDLNRASKESLLRVPGIGARGAHRILAQRRHQLLRVEDLPELGIDGRKAAVFVVGVGSRPGEERGLDRVDLRARFVAAARKTRFVGGLGGAAQLELFSPGRGRG
ncbi:MAG: putative DNA modification/repair radical SAM protein [Myxococcota bacterium]